MIESKNLFKMKKDIPNLKVEEVGIAIVPKDYDQLTEEFWEVYLINFKRDTIRNVLINSKGYGEIEGERTSTTVLRHYFDHVDPLTGVAVEPIHPRLFKLANEYWVSFVYKDHMYDKKYIFVRGSIDERNLTDIPILGRKVIFIK